MENVIITGLNVYGEQQTYSNGFIKIEKGLIKEIGSLNDINDITGYKFIQIPSSYFAVPGAIDIHIHGVNGADTMDASNDALSTMAEALPKEGTTSFLATTMTQSKHAIENALINAGEYIEENHQAGLAEIVGIHLEGPFLNYKRAGAQPFEYMLKPTIELFNQWQGLAQGHIKLVTIAPEIDGGLELIEYMSEQGVISSIGHSDATYDEMIKGIQAGAAHVTHLFNGMRGLHHRDPGTAGAALIHEELKTEIIADGIHVHPKTVKLAYHQKGHEGMIIITDAMRAKCLPNGEYELGGQKVFVEDGKAVLENGSLAGSVLQMNQAINNMMEFTGCSLRDVIWMSSVTPAKQLGIFDRKGSIEAGKDADIVILDENHNVWMTLCKGEIAYQREEITHEHLAN
ncbi:N-acetylglucosamine-6-phosphate deacetylase [Metabacillus arenae]|nr:N-acetylglucosamine-6-phosphate deacetylase [Metabacillus arenae]